MKRFYETVTVGDGECGHAVLLDGRAVMTPRRQRLLVPRREIASMIADEWARQGEDVDPESMPAMRLASSAIDTTAAERPRVIDMLVAYGRTDLVCHRADRPADLVERQTGSWQPVLDWVASAHGVRLHVAEGVMPLEQPAESLEALRRAVDRGDHFALTALHGATTTLGSIVVALALRDEAIGSEAAWAAGQLDESYQVEQWGEDEEAAARRDQLRREFEAAARILDLLRG